MGAVFSTPEKELTSSSKPAEGSRDDHLSPGEREIVGKVKPLGQQSDSRARSLSRLQGSSNIQHQITQSRLRKIQMPSIF